MYLIAIVYDNLLVHMYVLLLSKLARHQNLQDLNSFGALTSGDQDPWGFYITKVSRFQCEPTFRNTYMKHWYVAGPLESNIDL